MELFHLYKDRVISHHLPIYNYRPWFHPYVWMFTPKKLGEDELQPILTTSHFCFKRGWNVQRNQHHLDKGHLGGGFKYFFISIPTWGNDPIWLIFFRWVGSTTNQSFIGAPHLTLFQDRRLGATLFGHRSWCKPSSSVMVFEMCTRPSLCHGRMERCTRGRGRWLWFFS